MERMERELESARKKLEKVHQRRYQTDSETEQSGYVYSGITNFSNFDAIKIFLNFCSPNNYDMQKITNNSHGFFSDGDGFSYARLELYRLKGPIINKPAKSIVHRPLIHRPETRRGYSVIMKMGPAIINK